MSLLAVALLTALRDRGRSAGDESPQAQIDSIVHRVTRDGPSDQVEALADGQVSAAEYLDAVDKTRDCLVTNGITGLTDLTWRGPFADYEFDIPSTDDEDVYEICYERYQSRIDVVMDLQQRLAQP